MRFVIAAGGTGGHLFPGLAVGEVLLSRGHEVMLLISEKEIDALATQGRTEFRIEKLPGVGFSKLFSPAVFGFLKRFRAGLKRCQALYTDFSPDAVLGMGGFTSTAPILAGRIRGLPTFVHESNAIPGKANKLNARLVTCALLGFEECARYLPRIRTEVTGTPIRKTLTSRVDRARALATFGLSGEEGRKTLLVMGGSQGAHGINTAILSALPRLAGRTLQCIHLSGPSDQEALREAYKQADIPAWVAPFHHQMEDAYSAADLAVARSGAASLTELSHFSLPSILIPYPYAAEDHQTLNAKIFERAGAAVLLPERDASAKFVETLSGFLDDPVRLSEMSSRAASLGTRDAAERVADTILKFCQSKS